MRTGAIIFWDAFLSYLVYFDPTELIMKQKKNIAITLVVSIMCSENNAWNLFCFKVQLIIVPLESLELG